MDEHYCQLVVLGIEKELCSFNADLSFQDFPEGRFPEAEMEVQADRVNRQGTAYGQELSDTERSQILPWAQCESRCSMKHNLAIYAPNRVTAKLSKRRPHVPLKLRVSVDLEFARAVIVSS